MMAIYLLPVGGYSYTYVASCLSADMVWAQGVDLVSIMPVCVCSKVKEMGSFTASSE